MCNLLVTNIGYASSEVQNGLLKSMRNYQGLGFGEAMQVFCKVVMGVQGSTSDGSEIVFQCSCNVIQEYLCEQIKRLDLELNLSP